jgi:MFS family permease
MSQTLNKIFTRSILLVSFVSFFTDIASEMLYPVMPVFLKSIGFSIVLIGFLEGLAECLAGLGKGYFGNLSDKMGKRVPFIRIGYTLSAISKPLLAVFVFPIWIFFARTLDRIGKGVRTSARDALLSSETTPEHKGKVFGFHRGMDTAGAALGPVAALIFLFHYPGHYRWLFILAFVPGIIAVSLTYFLKENVVEVKRVKSKLGFFTYFKYWNRANSNYKFLIVGLLIFAFFNSSDVFLLLAVKNKGCSDVQMISYYIYYNLLYALLSFPVGIFADKIGMKKVLIFGLVVFATVYFGFGFANVAWHFAALFLLYAVYAASSEGISKAWITNICNKEDTATAIGFYTSMASIMALLASIVGGLIWFFFGPSVMFLFSGLGTLLVVLYLIVFKSRLG